MIPVINQFGHICLYRLQEGKWQKDGFEGASFLIERTAWPPYGLFILNHAGMHDYIHPNQPEDEVQTAEGEYLMYRSSSEFTAMRLNVAKSAPKSLTESWTDSHRHTPYANDPLTNWRYILNQKPDKGPYETVMFWFLVSDSEQHEPLSDTIERRAVSVQVRSASASRTTSHFDCVGFQEASPTSPVVAIPATPPQQSSASQPATTTTDRTVSDFDKLFSKLISSAPPAPTANKSKVTLETLFASASASASSTPTSNLVNELPTTTTKGALLGTIFASATPPPPGFGANTYSIT